MSTTPNSIITAQTPNAGIMNVVLSTAMTNTKAFDGTEAAGTAMAKVFEAGASGAILDEIRLKYGSTNGATASGTTNATVARIWLNNGSTNTTPGNNQFIGEVAILAQTVAALGTSEMIEFVFPWGKAIPANYDVYVGLTVTVGGTNCAIAVSANGGDL